jgi:hypothetical protein
MDNTSNLTTIGRAERIQLPELLGTTRIVAKVDTGADLSSLWATNIQVVDGKLQFVVLGPGSSDYTGRVISLPAVEYDVTRVASSFGQREERYVIKTPIKMHGRKVIGTFTLADRANKTYPILIGRRLLHGKFVVDVSAGEPLKSEERAKRERMRRELNNREDDKA